MNSYSNPIAGPSKPPPPKHSRKDEKTGGMTSKPRDEAQGKSKKMEDKATRRPSFPPPKKDRDVKTGVKKQVGNSRSKNGNPYAVIKYFNSCLHSN